jgi:hypothetical protein
MKSNNKNTKNQADNKNKSNSTMQTHQQLSAAGKKGAEVRAGKQETTKKAR